MKYTLISVCLISLIGCASLKESAKYGLNNGKYTLKTEKEPNKKIYLDNEDDTLIIYALDSNKTPTKNIYRLLPTLESLPSPPKMNIKKKTFDVDLLTIPFKYRPSTSTVPNQLNTNFNGAVFIGYRSDLYKINYRKSPLNQFKRTIRHFGYSIGIINGIGTTAMTPTTTTYNIDIEYDGIVYFNGIGIILAIDNLTLGVSLGYDKLLDKNKTFWVYQNKPWLGLVLGLNLN